MPLYVFVGGVLCCLGWYIIGEMGMPNAQGILWLCLMHSLLEEAAALVGMALLE